MGIGKQIFLPEEYRHLMGTGQTIRFNHDKCGDTRERLYVTQTDWGWIFHCHNCAPKMSGCFHNPDKRDCPPPNQTVKLLKSLGEVTVIDMPTVALPFDFTLELPKHALQWVIQYGITPEEIAKHKIGYSPSMDRVILSVFRGNRCIFWQGRNLGEITKKNPKYVSVQAKGVDKLFEIETGSEVLTVVEDILSAIKVSRVTSSLALLGSYLPDQLLPRLKKYKRVNMWLDSDKYMESVNFSKRLREFGNTVTTIMTDEDPKALPMETISGLTTR